MEVAGLKFLTSIDMTIRYRGAIYIQSKEHDQYYKAIDKLLRTYNQAGFTITTIHCDREFNEMIDPIKDELDMLKALPLVQRRILLSLFCSLLITLFVFPFLDFRFYKH